MKRISPKYLPALLFVLSGLLAGAALPELMHMGDGSYAGFASLYAVQKFETSRIQYMDVFVYVLSVRIITLLFLWMSCFTPAGKLFHLLYFWWLAASGGMLLALFALKKGGQGLILFGCSLLPQWILYAAMWKRELGFLFTGKFFWQNFASMFFLCITGSACESFLGIRLLKIFLEIFM